MMLLPLSNGRAQQLAGRVRALDRALILEAPTPVLQLTYATTSLQLLVRTTTNAALALYTSDGTSDLFRGSITKTFADARRRTSTLNTDRRLVDALTVNNSGVLAVNGPLGTADLRAFPNLVQCELQGSFCNVFAVNIRYNLTLDGAQCAGKTLDISEVNAAQIRASNTLANGVSWPAAGPAIQGIYLDAHALTSDQVLPALPSLVELYLPYNQAVSAQRLGRLDVSQNPQLQTLNLRQARVTELRVAAGGALTALNVIYNDFSPGQPASLLDTFKNSPQLTRIDGYNCGLDADSLEAWLDYLLSSKRPAVLVFGGGSVNNHYGLGGSVSGRACEPLVTAAAQAKLAQVRAAGVYVEINDPVFTTTILDDTTARIDLVNSTRAITWWQVGDTLNCPQPFNSDLFNYGNHTVLSGGGTSWVVSNTKQYAGFIGASGLSVVVKA